MELLNKPSNTHEETSQPRDNPKFKAKVLNDDKMYSASEYFQIIDTADLLQLSEQRRSQHRSEDLECLAGKGLGNVPESRIYELSQELGISDKYVAKAIGLISPSNSEKIDDLRKAGIDGFLGNDLINAYSKFLPDELKKAFPSEDFGYRILFGTQIEFYRIHKKPIKKRFFWKTWYESKEERIPIAEIRASETEGYVRLQLHSPIFLRACSETFKKLNEIFKARVDFIRRDYSIAPEELDIK